MIKKQFLKTRCKVTFEIPIGCARGAESIYLVGDFNDWDHTSTPMRRSAEKFSLSLTLEQNRDYQFCYLTDSGDWLNEDEADCFAPNSFKGFNSVVSTYLVDRIKVSEKQL